MKVILKQDVARQGKKGEVINVSDGYAKNFLFPRGLAVEADKGALREIESKKESAAHKVVEEKAKAAVLAERLSGLTVKITASAGADNKMYGSITGAAIAEKLEADHGIVIDKRKIVIEEPIKSFGIHVVEVKVFPEVTARLTVVAAEK